MRGFVLILVVDESQTESSSDSLVRVARDYDVPSYVELDQEVLAAAQQAVNQLALGRAWLRLRGRAEREVRA